MHGALVPYKARHSTLAGKLFAMVQGSFDAPPDAESSEVLEDSSSSPTAENETSEETPETLPEGHPHISLELTNDEAQERVIRLFSSAFKRMEKTVIRKLRSSRGHALPPSLASPHGHSGIMRPGREPVVSLALRASYESDTNDSDGSTIHVNSPHQSFRHTRRPSNVVIEMGQFSPPQNR